VEVMRIEVPQRLDGDVFTALNAVVRDQPAGAGTLWGAGARPPTPGVA
jgi:hypothetical protein